MYFPRRAGKGTPKVVKSQNVQILLLSHDFTHFHMQIRCKKTSPMHLNTHPTSLRGSGTEKTNKNDKPTFSGPGPWTLFSGPGPFKTSRGHVEMHPNFVLHRICIWIWVKPLYNRWDPNISGFYHLGVFFCEPFGENAFSKNAPKTKIWPCVA